MNKMTVLVCGGRKYSDYDRVCKELYTIIDNNGLQLEKSTPEGFEISLRIINGGANGADLLSTNFAISNFCEFRQYLADWKKYPKAAGPIRNQEMLDKEDVHLVLAFPGGRGTADMIRRARKKGIPVHEVSN
jgi:hypothetical protein